MRDLELIMKLISAEKKGRVYAHGPDGFSAAIGPLRIIASTGGGWDHVSVSCAERLPKYSEMKRVKHLVFKPHEWAIEYHAPASEHVNIHPYTLHMWRPQNETIPVPPREFV